MRSAILDDGKPAFPPSTCGAYTNYRVDVRGNTKLVVPKVTIIEKNTLIISVTLKTTSAINASFDVSKFFIETVTCSLTVIPNTHNAESFIALASRRQVSRLWATLS
jgi:hypothetical protein